MMWNYVRKQAFAGNIDGDNSPVGKQTKGDTFNPDENNSDRVFEYLADITGTAGRETPAVTAQSILTDGDKVTEKDKHELTGDTQEYVHKVANVVNDIKDGFGKAYTPSSDNKVRTQALASNTFENDTNKAIKQKKGYLSYLDKLFDGRKWNDAARFLTFDSPIVGATALGLGSYWLSKRIAPFLTKQVNKLYPLTEVDEQGNPILTEEDKDLTGKVVGGLTAATFLLSQFDTKRPWFGFRNYRKKASADDIVIQKKAFMPAPLITSDSMVPLGMAREMIAGNPALSPIARMEAMNVLNALPNQSENTGVTANKLINTAISNGLSAGADAAVGYLAASALGLNHPGRAAALTGATSFILRDIF